MVGGMAIAGDPKGAGQSEELFRFELVEEVVRLLLVPCARSGILTNSATCGASPPGFEPVEEVVRLLRQIRNSHAFPYVRCPDAWLRACRRCRETSTLPYERCPAGWLRACRRSRETSPRSVCQIRNSHEFRYVRCLAAWLRACRRSRETSTSDSEISPIPLRAVPRRLASSL